MLDRRQPMKRGRGFLRMRPSVDRSEREERRAANLAVLANTVGRMATYGGATSGEPIEKEDASQSEVYMRACKALGVCMRCGRRVQPLTGGLDFAHADLGKGCGIKTDVRRGAALCRACHEAVSRHMTRPVRRAVEYLLGVMQRGAVRDAGTWPKNLPAWKE